MFRKRWRGWVVEEMGEEEESVKGEMEGMDSRGGDGMRKRR